MSVSMNDVVWCWKVVLDETGPVCSRMGCSIFYTGLGEIQKIMIIIVFPQVHIATKVLCFMWKDLLVSTFLYIQNTSL